MAVQQLSKELKEHFNISEVLDFIRGGQKNVYIVKIDDDKFALKVIHIADERFKREVRICEEFKSNNGIPEITRIEDFEEETIILEKYIEGADLSDKVLEYRNNEKKVLTLISEISKILKPVWDKEYVHRDLKPQNIRIKTDDYPCVLDFGIARALNEATLTAASQPLSWKFASPEQFLGKKELISYRTDFFSLGIIAYYLYTGNLPFGSIEDQVQNKLMNSTTVFKSDTDSNLINTFCESVLKINPSQRPRNYQLFTQNL